jgi:hypothetical protein
MPSRLNRGGFAVYGVHPAFLVSGAGFSPQFTECLGRGKWDGATRQPANRNGPDSVESWAARGTASPRSLFTPSLVAEVVACIWLGWATVENRKTNAFAP